MRKLHILRTMYRDTYTWKRPTRCTFIFKMNIYGSVHRKYIPIYIQQDAPLFLNLTFMGPCIVNKFQCISNKKQLHTVYLYLEIALHVSGSISTHHQKCIQLYLQHLVFVTALLLPATIAAGSSNSVTNTRCCRYSRLHSWWWVMVPSETCRTVSR